MRARGGEEGEFLELGLGPRKGICQARFFFFEKLGSEDFLNWLEWIFELDDDGN
jgi:hypothetical protein